MDTLLRDLRYALTTLKRDKAFAVAALLTLALGIGATTAVFSTVYGVLLRPLPYPEPDRLVRVYEEHPGGVRMPGEPPLSNTTMYVWQQGMQTLEGIAAYYGREYTVAASGDSPDAERVHGAEAASEAFALLRATPELGRFFVAREDRPDANKVVVISDRLWRERFGARPDAIGATLTLDDQPHEIVGVARPDFRFPDRDVQLWTPYEDPTLTDPATQGGMWVAPTIGRLRPGVTLTQAEAEGTTAARSVKRPAVADALFGVGGPVRVYVDSYSGMMTSKVRPVLLVVTVSVALVLLVACANVGNLLLSRGVARQRELAIRAAIGASAPQLRRQLLTESFVVSAGGGALGIALASALLRLAPRLAPADFPRLDDIRIDATVMTFALAASVATAFLAGLAPALRGARFELISSLRGAGDGAAAGGFRSAEARRLRDVLLVFESAMAALLLIGAALFGRSFERLTHVDPGYQPHNVLLARLYPSSRLSNEQRHQFVEGVIGQLSSGPGVMAAAAANMVPFSEVTWISTFTIPESIGEGKATHTRVRHYVVTPDYAVAIGLHLREGRFLTANDRATGRTAMVVNREFVREYLRDRGVAGTTFQGGPHGSMQTEIVGVVDDVLKDGNDDRVHPEVYTLASPTDGIRDEVDLLVRTAGNPAAAAPAVRAAVRASGPDAAVGEVMPLTRRMATAVDQPRFAVFVLTAFAALALTLAAVGLYGVLSYTVSQRRRELSVRVALGAAPGDLVRLVLREGLVLAAAGLMTGMIAAAAASRLLTGILFGITPLDALAFLAAPAVLLPIAIAACLPSAFRAAADPGLALRGE